MTGSGSEQELQVVLARVFQNGLGAATQAAINNGFRITRPIAEDKGACSLPCWTLIADKPAEGAFLAEAIIRYSRGSLLFTYESPFIAGAEETFRGLLKLIYEKS